MLEGEMNKMGMDPAKMQQEVQVMMPRIKETLVKKAKDMGIDYHDGGVFSFIGSTCVSRLISL